MNKDNATDPRPRSPAAMTTVRKLKSKGAVFVVTFDADGVLDTVERNGVNLTANNAAVKIIANSASQIRVGVMPARMEITGWTWVRK